MEKTAMQDAIGIIKFHLEASDPRFVAGLELVMEEFENNELLSKEREQIVEAHTEGQALIVELCHKYVGGFEKSLIEIEKARSGNDDDECAISYYSSKYEQK